MKIKVVEARSGTFGGYVEVTVAIPEGIGELVKGDLVTLTVRSTGEVKTSLGEIAEAFREWLRQQLDPLKLVGQEIEVGELPDSGPRPGARGEKDE